MHPRHTPTAGGKGLDSRRRQRPVQPSQGRHGQPRLDKYDGPREILGTAILWAIRIVQHRVQAGLSPEKGLPRGDGRFL